MHLFAIFCSAGVLKGVKPCEGQISRWQEGALFVAEPKQSRTTKKTKTEVKGGWEVGGGHFDNIVNEVKRLPG